MTYRITSLAAFCFLLAASSCTTLKQSGSHTAIQSPNPVAVNKQPRFLEDISITPESSTTRVEGVTKTKPAHSGRQTRFTVSPGVEKASALQFKYAQLLNTEVENVKSLRLFEVIDKWYGTRYCLGGNSASCIDCSAFVQNLFSEAYGVSVPRTAREQYNFSKKISSTMLREGDLLFFNTRGGISHVGIYLQNNKFVHASTSGGVIISDMFEPYYVKRFISAGRIDKNTDVASRKK